MRFVLTLFFVTFLISVPSFSAVSNYDACGLYIGNHPDDIKLVECIEIPDGINGCNLDSAVRWWPRQMDSRAMFKELLLGEAIDCDQMPDTLPKE